MAQVFYSVEAFLQRCREERAYRKAHPEPRPWLQEEGEAREAEQRAAAEAQRSKPKVTMRLKQQPAATQPAHKPMPTPPKPIDDPEPPNPAPTEHAPAAPEPAALEPTAPEPVAPEPAALEPAAPEPTMPAKLMASFMKLAERQRANAYDHPFLNLYMATNASFRQMVPDLPAEIVSFTAYTTSPLFRQHAASVGLSITSSTLLETLRYAKVLHYTNYAETGVVIYRSNGQLGCSHPQGHCCQQAAQAAVCLGAPA